MILLRTALMWAGLAAVILAVLTGCYAIGRGWVNAFYDTPALRRQTGLLLLLCAAQLPVLSGVIYGDVRLGWISSLICGVLIGLSLALCFRVVRPPPIRTR